MTFTPPVSPQQPANRTSTRCVPGPIEAKKLYATIRVRFLSVSSGGLPGINERRWPTEQARGVSRFAKCRAGYPEAGVKMSNRSPLTEEQIRAAHVGEVKRLDGRVEIVDYDPRWAELFEREAARIRGTLGERALRIEHVGSTSVAGLPAKPVIDILLVVTDSADETSYVPLLAAAGYRLHVREPGWYEHRMFKGPDTDINLHTFSAGCHEIDRMLIFRDWLRVNPADRELYARTKFALAQKEWAFVQNYADAKGAVINAIIDRAR